MERIFTVNLTGGQISVEREGDTLILSSTAKLSVQMAKHIKATPQIKEVVIGALILKREEITKLVDSL